MKESAYLTGFSTWNRRRASSIPDELVEVTPTAIRLAEKGSQRQPTAETSGPIPPNNPGFFLPSSLQKKGVNLFPIVHLYR